jgi:2-iminobutanoate/2-iminopropanoate deaminase
VDIINSVQAPAAIGPYSQAVSATGEWVFCSGQIPIDPATGEVVRGSASDQTRQILSNLNAVLSAAGCTFRDVAKTTIYLRDMNDFAAVNEVYALAMQDHRPARATVGVSGLPKDVSVEIDCIAVRRPPNRSWL